MCRNYLHSELRMRIVVDSHHTRVTIPDRDSIRKEASHGRIERQQTWWLEPKIMDVSTLML